MKLTPLQVHGTHYTRWATFFRPWVKVDFYLCPKEQTQAIFKANKLALASLMFSYFLQIKRIWQYAKQQFTSK